MVKQNAEILMYFTWWNRIQQFTTLYSYSILSKNKRDDWTTTGQRRDRTEHPSCS